MYENDPSQVETSFSTTAGATLRRASTTWLKIIAMIITASFTGQAGLALTANYFYALAAIVLAEGAFLFWEHQFRHSENVPQHVFAGSGWVISIAAITLTDLASATLLAHNAKLFNLFASIPAWVQNVITYTMATLAVSNAVLAALYHFVSDSDAIARSHARAIRRIEQQKASARMTADVEIAKSQANTLLAMVQQGAAELGHGFGLADWQQIVAQATQSLAAKPTTQTPRLLRRAPATSFPAERIREADEAEFPELSGIDRGNGRH